MTSRIKNKRNKFGFYTGSIKRRIGGKIFTNVASKPTKAEARTRADAWRAGGQHRARVVKVKGGYDIYINPLKRR